MLNITSKTIQVQGEILDKESNQPMVYLYGTINMVTKNPQVQWNTTNYSLYSQHIKECNDGILEFQNMINDMILNDDKNSKDDDTKENPKKEEPIPEEPKEETPKEEPVPEEPIPENPKEEEPKEEPREENK